IKEVQALILVPTRELALQYVDEIAWIAKETHVDAFAVYGGFSMEIQKGKLEHGVQILVATPGRLIDLLYNSPLRLAEVRYFVLDEADEMLNQGFLTDIERTSSLSFPAWCTSIIRCCSAPRCPTRSSNCLKNISKTR
ncbi:MAG: DEAD/DEAH box helicase, partial [Planctomycetota bacterium]